ncbi:MAG: hypothetical protein R6U35_03985 [Candidatus Humimicrobiaceae bacterium]
MPYIDVIAGILNEVKVWLFTLIGIVSLVVIVIQGFRYQGGDSAEKQEAIRNIKRTVIMGGGIFVLAWFATYVIDRMSAV